MKKKILITLIALLLPAFVILNSIAEDSDVDNDFVEVNNDIMIDSPLFTSKETNEVYNQPVVSMIMDEFKLLVSNSNFELYVNDESGSIRIVNKKTNYVWSSDVLNLDDYDLRPIKIRQLTSSFEMQYRDASGSSGSMLSTDSGIKINTSVVGNVVNFNIDNTKIDIKFSYSIELTEEGIEVKLPHTSIDEYGDSLLTSISLFPYLGATFGNTVPGYLFIPSGNGGLVRFDKNPAINALYEASYYGTDANRTKDTEGAILSLPVYGVTHGVEQNAMFTRIKSGASSASFRYVPSNLNPVDNITLGKTSGFHQAYNTFHYRQPYNIVIPGSKPILIIPEDYYKNDVEISYSFLDGDDADYIGMAHTYQKDLKEEGLISQNSNAGSGNVHLDILGGETESGILFDKFVKMTTTKQLLEINDELTKKTENKYLYTLRGFYKNGYSRQNASNIKFESKLGNVDDISDLDYYMYYNPVETYGENNSSSNKVLVNIFNENNYITVEKDVKYKFYADVDTIVDGVNNVINEYPNSVAFDALGYRLYGDNNNDYTREDVLNKYSSLFDSTYPMFKPNEYMLSNTSHYLNMTLYHDRLRFITDSVPFLQIVLRGYVDYYSTYLNFSTNQEIDLLKCIEYGSNLAYLISYEESYLIANTLSSHLYATHYESNKKNMLEQINDANIVLNHVKGETIEDRIVIAAGVMEVTYSNGVKIYVNYNNSDYQYNDVVIESMGYKVVN